MSRTKRQRRTVPSPSTGTADSPVRQAARPRTLVQSAADGEVARLGRHAVPVAGRRHIAEAAPVRDRHGRARDAWRRARELLTVRHRPTGPEDARLQPPVLGRLPLP